MRASTKCGIIIRVVSAMEGNSVLPTSPASMTSSLHKGMACFVLAERTFSIMPCEIFLKVEKLKKRTVCN